MCSVLPSRHCTAAPSILSLRHSPAEGGIKASLCAGWVFFNILHSKQGLLVQSNHMYKSSDLLALCNHCTQASCRLPCIYLHGTAWQETWTRKNGVTHPGSPPSVMEQELGKSLTGFSSAPHLYISPPLPLRGQQRQSAFPNRNPSSNTQDEGREGKHKAERFA